LWLLGEWKFFAAKKNMTERLDDKEIAMNQMHQGEPMAGISPVAVEIYKASLKKLGVEDDNIERCVSYLTDPNARARREITDKTVPVAKTRREDIIDTHASAAEDGKSVIATQPILQRSELAQKARNQTEQLHRGTIDCLRILDDETGHTLSVIEAANAAALEVEPSMSNLRSRTQ
jgi:hypothetical protein